MNTLPEWFTVEPNETRYTIHNVIDGTSRTMTGVELRKSLPVTVSQDEPLRLKVAPTK
jgi:hypothetical protein